MAAPIPRLTKVGFNFRQATALHLLDDATAPTLKKLVQSNFTTRQARALLKGTPAVPPTATTPGTPYQPPSFVVLVREGGFTRNQAKLIREA